MWYYKTGESQVGPLSKAQVQQLINDRKINGETLVRKQGEQGWVPLKKLSKKRARKPAPEPGKKSIKQKAFPPSDNGNPPAESIPAEPLKAGAGDLPEPESQNIPFKFSGSGKEYFKIWIVNILLSIVTLGIYSAWAKVRSKQYFYGSTEVESASFQYLADPFLILKGRLIVFGGFIAYSFVNQFYPQFGMVLSLILIPALPWFIVRSLSFNAGNSAIRNIRFRFKGTYWEAFRVFLLWPLLLPLTLGLISPYLFYRQRKFVVENSSYGTVPFEFKATAKDYYLLFFGLMIPLAICIALFAAAGFFFHLPVSSPMFLTTGFIVVYLYAMAYFAVKANNLFYNSSNLSNQGFEAKMTIREYIFILITNTIGTVFTLGLFYPFAKVRAYRYKAEHLALVSNGDLNAFVAAEQEQITALGDEVADLMDFDFGL